MACFFEGDAEIGVHFFEGSGDAEGDSAGLSVDAAALDEDAEIDLVTEVDSGEGSDSGVSELVGEAVCFEFAAVDCDFT